MNTSNIQKEQPKNNKSSSVDSNSSLSSSSADQSKENAYSDEDLNILNTLGNFKNSTDLVTEGMVVIPSINMYILQMILVL